MLRTLRKPFALTAQAALAFGLMLAGVAPSSGGGAAFAQPNVVMFVADDMGWTDWQYDAQFNPTGSVVYETPNLLRLAGESVNFRNAYAAAPICSPTRTSILTGKSSARHRMTNYLPGTPNVSATLKEPAGWVKNFPLADVTLAESFNAAGYATGFFGKWHLGTTGNPSASPTAVGIGFQTNVGGTHFSSPPLPDGYFAGADGRWFGMPGLESTGQFPSDKYLSEALADQAVDYIAQKAAAEEPFFMSFWDYAPHIPVQAPASLVTKYQNKIATLQSMGVNLNGHTNATYAAMMEKMDEGIGRLLDRLEDPNDDMNPADSIRNNTIFIFTSDNGGTSSLDGEPQIPTRNLPLREGKGSMYEGGIREPLMVSWLGNNNLQPGSLSDARSSSYDLYPTVLDLAGLWTNPLIPKNTVIDGVSIRDALEGDAFERGKLYWHYPHRSNQDQTSAQINGGAFVSSVLDGDWKLLFYYEDRHYELYNLATDIGETTNLLTANPSLGHELSAALNSYLVSVNAQMPLLLSNSTPVAPPTVLNATTAGDYNGDGNVDAGDYLAWKTNYGSTTHLEADGNHNRVVDAADYIVWRNIRAGIAGSGAVLPGGGTVPEPNLLVLVALLATIASLINGRSR